MTKEFVDLVEKMRNAQKDFFKGRLPDDLKKSKDLERQVDKLIMEFNSKQKNHQGKIF